jgi:hypothetical protein
MAIAAMTPTVKNIAIKSFILSIIPPIAGIQGDSSARCSPECGRCSAYLR